MSAFFQQQMQSAELIEVAFKRPSDWQHSGAVADAVPRCLLPVGAAARGLVKVQVYEYVSSSAVGRHVHFRPRGSRALTPPKQADRNAPRLCCLLHSANDPREYPSVYMQIRIFVFSVRLE